MVYTAYECETLTMKRIQVAGGGMSNGNAYAIIEIIYTNEFMDEVDSVWYKEFGKNPISKRIGNDVEWSDDNDSFKVLEDGEYVDEEDKEEEEEEKIPLCVECKTNKASKNQYYPDSEGGEYWNLCDTCFKKEEEDEED